MATSTTQTTRPSRARKATTPAAKATAAAKATPAKAAPAAAVEAPVEAAPVKTAVADDGRTKIQFDMVALDPSKSYAKFNPPAGSGCVGTLYVPLGTEDVKVLLIGPTS